MVSEYDFLINEICKKRKAVLDNKIFKENHPKIRNMEVLARNLVLEKIKEYQKESNDVLVGVIHNDK